MTKLYLFIRKILGLEQKPPARLNLSRIDPSIAKIEADRAKKMLLLRAKKREMDQLVKKYRNRPPLSKRYEKWI